MSERIGEGDSGQPYAQEPPLPPELQVRSPLEGEDDERVAGSYPVSDPTEQMIRWAKRGVALVVGAAGLVACIAGSVYYGEHHRQRNDQAIDAPYHGQPTPSSSLTERISPLPPSSSPSVSPSLSPTEVTPTPAQSTALPSVSESISAESTSDAEGAPADQQSSDNEVGDASDQQPDAAPNQESDQNTACGEPSDNQKLVICAANGSATGYTYPGTNQEVRLTLGNGKEVTPECRNGDWIFADTEKTGGYFQIENLGSINIANVPLCDMR